MKAGDRVCIEVPEKAFSGKSGVIVKSMLPDYDWAVLVDGMSTDPDDSYGFAESELVLQ